MVVLLVRICGHSNLLLDVSRAAASQLRHDAAWAFQVSRRNAAIRTET